MKMLTRSLVLALWACLLLAGCSLVTTGPISPVPKNFYWDSGEQQCQIGSMKLVYRYRMMPSSEPGVNWQLWYSVRAEEPTGGGNWSTTPALYRLYYFFNYVGGAAPTVTGNVEMNHKAADTGVILKGHDYHLFDTRVLTLKRYGGAHGVEVTWPNSQGCVFS